MATASLRLDELEQRERVFFLSMALLVTGVAVSGFAMRLALGITSFRVPWWVHVYAISYMAWVGFYLLQNALVVKGLTGLHHRLGIAGAFGAAWIVVVGVLISVQALALGQIPPFFSPEHFLSRGLLNLACFAGLTYAAIALRRAPDWHRRLMLCATLSVAIPGFARWIILIAPPPDEHKHLLAVGLLAAPAVVFDLATRGRVHRSYWWGLGSIVLSSALVDPIAAIPAFQTFTHALAGLRLFA